MSSPNLRTTSRRAFLQTTAAAGVVIATGANAQTAWPEHNVRIVVPYPAGGSTDVLARFLADRLKDMFGQTFVIENRPGAGGNIGITTVTTSAPDGYTIGAATVGHFAINQFGTSPHLSGVMFTKLTGLDAVHVPFRGAAQTIPAMLSGDVNFAIDNLASYVPFFQSGKMRALAVTSAQRWPTMPDVPTMGEAGIKDFVVTSWAAFVVPAGTPRPIIDKIAAAMKTLAADAELQKKFQVAGARCIASTPEEAIAYAAKERAMWKAAVALSGARAE